MRGKQVLGKQGIADVIPDLPGDCGEEIAEERLQVAPCAPCCISCQEKREGPSHPPGATL